MPKDNFNGLLDDLAELDRRRGADGQIMKAIQTAGDAIRSDAALREWVGDLHARAAAREKASRQPTGGGRTELRKSIERATDLLKSAVLGGKLTAVEACAYEARIHHMAEGLR